MDTNQVVLQATDDDNRTQRFSEQHAERLLAYPGTKWVKAEAEAPTDTDKLPANKAGWLKLYRDTYPDEVFLDDEISIKQMRDKLGK